MTPRNVLASETWHNVMLSSCTSQVITVSCVPGMDSDWLMGERGNQKGKVPITYLELLNWDPPDVLRQNKPTHHSATQAVISYLYRVAGTGVTFTSIQSISAQESDVLVQNEPFSSWRASVWVKGKETAPFPGVYTTCSMFVKPCFHASLFAAMPSAVCARTSPKLYFYKFFVCLSVYNI